MGRSKNKINVAKKKGYNLTKNSLKNWGVKYHELIFGKPTFDLYIDDKNLFHKKNWLEIIDKEIFKI